MGTVRCALMLVVGLTTTLGAGCGDDTPPPEGPAILEFEAEPSTVDLGEPATLRWVVRAAESLRIFDGGGRILLESTSPADEGELITPAIRSRTEFTLEIRGGGPRSEALRQEVGVEVDAPDPVFLETSVVPSSILAGQAAALRWRARDAIAVSVATSTGGAILDAGPLEGEVIVRPPESRTYVLTARGFDQDATAMLSVTVGNRPPSVERLVATPPSVRPGDASKVSWQVAGATRIRIEDTTTATVAYDGAQLRGSVVVRPAASTDYRLTADGTGGTTTATVRVTVLPIQPITLSRFELVPNPAARGEAVEARWSVSGADRVELRQDGPVLITDAPPTGRVPVLSAGASSTLTLTATGAAGSIQASRTLFVHDPPAIGAFGVEPRARTTDGPVRIRWDVDPVVQLTLAANGAPVPGFPTLTATTGPQGQSSGTVVVTATRTSAFELSAATAAGAVTETRLFVRGVEEAEPNDVAEEALPPPPAGVTRDYLGSAGGGDLDRYAIAVPAGGSVAATTHTGPGRCGVDTRIRLIAPDGSVLVEDDDGGRDQCSSLGPDTDPGAGLLPAGNYQIEVEESGGDPYVLTLGPGNQTCGDGRRDPPESCDDGNQTSGDGCSAQCGLETTGLTLSPPGGTTAAGTLTSTQARVFRLSVTGPGQSVTATASDPGGTCATVDTRLELLDAVGRRLVDARGGGPTGAAGTCGAFDPLTDRDAANLRAGTYYLRVTNEGPATGPVSVAWAIRSPACGNRIVESRVGEQCDDGNRVSGDGCSDQCAIEGGAVGEQEPNDRQADATPSGLLGAGRIQLRGEIRPAGDDDVIAFEVPPLQTVRLRARTYSLRGQPTSCDRRVTDTRIFVERAGTEVSAPGQGEIDYNDDLDPANNVWCSEVSGIALTGGIAGSTYYVRIQGWRDQATATWFLDLELSL